MQQLSSKEIKRLGYIRGGQTISNKYKKTVIQDFRKVHDTFYDYDSVEYINRQSVITVICPIHGDFKIKAMNHLLGGGCQRCANSNSGIARTLSTDEFVRRAKIIHGERFDYSKSRYVSYKDKVIIGCRQHGDFVQKVESHLKGAGCLQCWREYGWKERWIRSAQQRKETVGTLYVIEFHDDIERFIKLGITNKSIDSRYSGRDIPYDYKRIYTLNGPLNVIWELEKQLLRVYKQYRYTPTKVFGGMTECFTPELLKHINEFEEYRNQITC